MANGNIATQKFKNFSCLVSFPAHCPTCYAMRDTVGMVLVHQKRKRICLMFSVFLPCSSMFADTNTDLFQFGRKTFEATGAWFLPRALKCFNHSSTTLFKNIWVSWLMLQICLLMFAFALLHLHFIAFSFSSTVSVWWSTILLYGMLQMLSNMGVTKGPPSYTPLLCVFLRSPSLFHANCPYAFFTCKLSYRCVCWTVQAHVLKAHLISLAS